MTVTSDVEPDEAALGLARRLGRAEAEAADASLRLKESQRREQRFENRIEELEASLETARTNEHELRQQIENYARFHQAIERSRSWRLLQLFRSMVGRKW
jgi:septal ring factor EnvC (AmiA/AmiB activator)